MAMRETLTRNGKQELCVNIEAPVGPPKEARVKNLPGDVMLIQSILFTLASRIEPAYIGFRSMDEVPKPTGQFDLPTETGIRRYQQKQSSQLLAVDGIVDPASYQDRKIIDHVDSRLMTITNMHLDLLVLFDPSDYRSELTRMVPQLLPWLG